MANLKLTELANNDITKGSDILYSVQNGTSKQIPLSTFFSNIPSEISQATGFEILSGGSNLFVIFNNEYANKIQRTVTNLNGGTQFPTFGDSLSSFGNHTVALSTNNVNYITVTVPYSGTGMPSKDWEIKFIQTGTAQIFLSAGANPDNGAEHVTFFGSGSGRSGPPASYSSAYYGLTSHMTPNQYSTLTLSKLDDLAGGNTYVALTASQ